MIRRIGLILTTTLAAAALASPVALASPQRGTAASHHAAIPVAAPALPAYAPSRRPANIAHRGASAYAPENTIAAFKLAAKQKADLFELDVQESKDHKLVLMHDTTLARTTNVEQLFPDRAPWNVKDFTLAEIRKLDAGSWFSDKYKGEKIPTLGATLKTMRSSRLGLLLEVKRPDLYPGTEKRIAAKLRDYPYWLAPDPRERRLIVQSFDFASMKAFHGLLPKVPVGLLGTPKVEQLPELAKYADQINTSYRDVTDAYVKRVHELKMETFPWTVDDAEQMKKTLALGVDGIITNKPDVLRQVIGARVRQPR